MIHVKCKSTNDGVKTFNGLSDTINFIKSTFSNDEFDFIEIWQDDFMAGLIRRCYNDSTNTRTYNFFSTIGSILTSTIYCNDESLFIEHVTNFITSLMTNTKTKSILYAVQKSIDVPETMTDTEIEQLIRLKYAGNSEFTWADKKDVQNSLFWEDH